MTPLFTESDLGARLEDADDEVRLWAASRLAEGASEAGLRALIESADPRAAQRGLQAVSRRARRELVPAVLERYRASDGEVADAGAHVLALLGEESWLEEFRARGRPVSQAAAVGLLGTEAASAELEALLQTAPAAALAGLLRYGRGDPAARRLVDDARRLASGADAETPGLEAALELLGRKTGLKELAREVPVRPGRALQRAGEATARPEPPIAGRLLRLRRRGLSALAGALAARREEVLALAPPFREGVAALASLAADAVEALDSAPPPPPSPSGDARGRLEWLLSEHPRDPVLSAEVEGELAAAGPGNILHELEGNILHALPRPEAVRLCGAWGVAEALDPLLDLATPEALQAAAMLPGAVERLAALAATAGPRRRAAVEALGFAGSREAARALAGAFDALWREERRALHRAAMRLAAGEFIDPLRGVLRHGEPGDEHAYAFLCAVHRVSDAAAERARDETLRRAAGELFELELQCEACGAVHAYRVREAVVDPEETTPFLPERIACKSCGTQDRYAFTDAAYQAIAAEVERAQEREGEGAAARGDERPPRVRFIRLRALGLSPDPRAALARCDEVLAARPRDVAAMLARAAALDLLGRADEAREGWLAAQAADPLAVEALLALARDATRRGEAHAQEAFGYALACAQRMRAGRFHHVRDRSAFRAEALALLALTAQRAGVDLDSLAELPAPEPAAAAAPQRPARAPALPGRNDPCPCGSGRKYKHCHGR